ncbi:MAG TPA: hypothetical protein VFM13_11995 [Gaiellaceae bacterium]|nr:hypothetical protein [Gaiellaceae bacterium]
MLAAAIAIVVAGLILSMFLGFFGFIVAAVGLVLFAFWLIGLIRAEPSRPAPRPRAD